MSTVEDFPMLSGSGSELAHGGELSSQWTNTPTPEHPSGFISRWRSLAIKLVLFLMVLGAVIGIPIALTRYGLLI
jgi:hypothetical protein